VSRPTDEVIDAPAMLGVVDVDVHNNLDSLGDLYPYLSRRWRQHLERFGVRVFSGSFYPRMWGRRRDAGSNSVVPGASQLEMIRETYLDRYRVAWAIVNPLTEVGRLTNLQLDAALATAVNDWQTEVWLDREPRLRASIAISLENPAQAVRELTRRALDRRFVQVQITGRPSEPMGRPKYWPIYEACAALGVHVMTHAFGSAGQPITGAGWPSSYLEDHVAPAQAMQANLVSMIVEGVFDRFPALKLVSLENGFGWLPSLMWRLDHAWGLLGSEVPDLDRPPSEYVPGHFYLSTQPIEEPGSRRGLAQLFDLYPYLAECLLFSSDYPHWDAELPDASLMAGVPDAIQRSVYSANAIGLYDLAS
jgi:uncharacterized protein